MTIDTLRLRADLRKAQRLTPAEYTDPVWDDHLAEISDYEEGCFRNVGALLARHREEDEAPPAWVWASKPVGFSLDAENILGWAVDNAISDGLISEDAEVSREEIAELQVALDAWTERMATRGRWGREVDRSRVVVLDAARFTRILAIEEP